MDDIDRQLIGLLRNDARASVASLAKKLGVARGTVQNRMARLAANGTILGYTVRLKPDAAEPRVRAVDLLERVDEAGRRERMRRQPPAGVRERDAHDRDEDTHQRQASHARGPAFNAKPAGGIRTVPHGSSASILPSVARGSVSSTG